jgi:hypothetical protein
MHNDIFVTGIKGRMYKQIFHDLKGLVNRKKSSLSLTGACLSGTH